MSLSDLLDVLDIADFLMAWRFWLPTLGGAALGLLIYFGGAGGVLPAVLGTGIGLAGVVTGLVWQHRHG